MCEVLLRITPRAPGRSARDYDAGGILYVRDNGFTWGTAEIAGGDYVVVKLPQIDKAELLAYTSSITASDGFLIERHRYIADINFVLAQRPNGDNTTGPITIVIDAPGILSKIQERIAPDPRVL